MSKILSIFVAVFLCWMASSANAAELVELRTRLNAARTTLVTMIFHKELRGVEQQNLVKDTADAVSAELAKMKIPLGQEVRFGELVETWNAFKETREKELVPAILAGDEEAVGKIAWGIQKTRYMKCLALIRELENTGFVSPAYGSVFLELGLRITEARMSLLDMMRHQDKRGADQQKLVKDTADAVSIKLEEIRAPVGKEAQFKDLTETWNAFKETRENELVPAILKGNEEEAKKIAQGIQQARLSKILALNKELNQYSLLATDNEGNLEDFRARISAARNSLVDMLRHKDKRGADQQKLVQDTADMVSEQIEQMRARAGKEAKLNLLIETWSAFKKTREMELVPAILQGKEAEAKALAYGIQNQRLMKCLSLAGNLYN